jgi:hypothetical protein
LVSDKKQIVKMLTALGVLFPHANLTTETYLAYAGMLEDLPLDELAPAMKQVAAESEFFPTVAKIRDKVLELRRLQDDTPTAFEAWQAVQEAVQTRRYKTPDFHPRAADAIMQTMGRGTVLNALNALALTDVDDVTNFVQPRFLRCYDLVDGKSRTEQAMLPEVRDAALRILSGQAVALESKGVGDELG